MNTYKFLISAVFIHVSIQRKQQDVVRSVLEISSHIPVAIINVTQPHWPLLLIPNDYLKLCAPFHRSSVNAATDFSYLQQT
jgi:hypothetical protein